MGRTILWTSFYQDRKPERAAELEHCIYRNIANPHIDVMVVLLEGKKKDFPILKHKKIQVVEVERPTFRTFFDLINYNVEPDDISMVSNTDIYFDESVELMRKVLNPDTCLALSRWHYHGPGHPEGDIVLHNEKFSQDVWVFMGKVKKIIYADFFLGIRGCDNRIAYELNQAGYYVFNPARSIRCIHYHRSEIRNYGNETVKMPYLPVPVSSI